jgi:hypothetical protein
MTRGKTILVFFLGIAGAITLTDQTNAELKDIKTLLPEDVGDWQAKQPDGEYNYDNLFDLIDGGAEMYRSLNVKKVISRTYSKEGGAGIIVDLFDMGSSSDAFGAFHCDIREDEDVGLGRESEFQGGSLYFWKDRYFVSVVALEETAATKEAVLALGRKTAQAIPRDGAGPKLVGLLPQKHLQKKELYYFHDLAALRRRLAVSGENPLNLSDKTEGLLARYRGVVKPEASPKESSALFLVIDNHYEKDASAAARDMAWASLEKAEPGQVMKIKENRFQGYYLKGAHLFVVLEASRQDIAQYLLDSSAKGK